MGWQRELALLHDRWEVVRAGEGQVVSLVGPSGMGKTRLLTEFGRRLALDQVPWYRGQCLAYGQAIPYLPVRDVVQHVCTLYSSCDVPIYGDGLLDAPDRGGAGADESTMKINL